MAKAFSTKKYRLRARSRRRRQGLKINAPVQGRKQSLQEKNLEVIRAIEAKLNA